MTLIAMAVYDTEENQRTEMTARTLDCLMQTVDREKHRIFIIDNNSCKATKNLLSEFVHDPDWGVTVLTMEENIGTARAINQAWKHREPGEHCIKMDNDVIIHSRNWLEQMEEVLTLRPEVGILGLKRKDCWENPGHQNPDYKSELMFAGPLGTRWITIESVKHVIGTCQLYNSALLDKIGFLCQPGLYGYDDVIASHRSKIAGFLNCFLPGIEIDHIDPGQTPYQGWKEREAAADDPISRQWVKEYYSGKKDIYQALY